MSHSATNRETAVAIKQAETGRLIGRDAGVLSTASVVCGGSSGRGRANRLAVPNCAGIIGPTASRSTAKVASCFRTAFTAFLPAILASRLGVIFTVITSCLTAAPESRKGLALIVGLGVRCISGPSIALAGRAGRPVGRPKITGPAAATAVSRCFCPVMAMAKAPGAGRRSMRFRSMLTAIASITICHAGSPYAAVRAGPAIIRRGPGPICAICGSCSIALAIGRRLSGYRGIVISAADAGPSSDVSAAVRPWAEMGRRDRGATASFGSALCTNSVVAEGPLATRAQHFKIWSAAHLAAMRDFRICIFCRGLLNNKQPYAPSIR